MKKDKYSKNKITKENNFKSLENTYNILINESDSYKNFKSSIDSLTNLDEHKREINLLAVDPREIYIADLGHFLKIFSEEMNDENIKLCINKFKHPEDIKMERRSINYDIYILNFRIGPTGFTENEIRSLIEKKLFSINKPVFILFVSTLEKKLELRNYSSIGTIIDIYLDITSSYCYGSTCLREALIMILKDKSVLNSNYIIKDKRMVGLYGTHEEEINRIEKEIIGGKIISEIEESSEQLSEEEFVN